jgi:hypothetical protein
MIPTNEREIRTVRESISADNQVQVRMPPDLRRAIEDFRRNEPDIPTRPEAIRRLLKRAVMARQEQPASNLHDDQEA